MHAKLRVTLVLMVVSIFSISIVSAQTCTIPGTRPATIDDAVVQNGTIRVGTCYNPSEIGISQGTEQAKVFLNSVPKKCVGACAAPPDKAHIDHLNDTFAVCAADFIKAYNQKYGTIYISSAYRDGPSGENARAGGAIGSNHTKGLAMDMSPANGDFQTMWKFASQNPEFGVCFPYLGSDRPHMTLAGSGTGESGKCAAQGVTRQCSGAPILNVKSVSPGSILPNSLYDEGGAAYGNTGSAIAPGSMLLSPTAPAPQFPGAPPITTAPITNPATTPTTGAPICTPQFSCSNNVMYYQTSSCLTQVYQTCPNGCSGNACAVITPSTGTSTLTATTTVSASSTNDLLNALSNPVSFTSAPVGSAISLTLALNGNISNAVGLSGTGTTTTIKPGTIASIQPLTSQQTFTSSDLSNPSASSYNTQQLSGTFKILSDLRAALVWALNFLNPFSANK